MVADEDVEAEALLVEATAGLEVEDRDCVDEDGGRFVTGVALELGSLVEGVEATEATEATSDDDADDDAGAISAALAVEGTGTAVDAITTGAVLVVEAFTDGAALVAGGWRVVETTTGAVDCFGGGLGADDARGVVHTAGGRPRSISMDEHAGTVEGQQHVEPVHTAPLGQHPAGQSKKGLGGGGGLAGWARGWEERGGARKGGGGSTQDISRTDHRTRGGRRRCSR